MVIREVLFLRVRKPPSSLRIFGSGGHGTSQKLRRYDPADANPRSSVRIVSAAVPRGAAFRGKIFGRAQIGERQP